MEFSIAQLEDLRKAYNGIKTAPVSCLPKFRAMFSKMPDNAVIQLRDAGIRFVSSLALNELIRRENQEVA